MKVLVAEPSGVIGRRAVRRLVAAGHAVSGLVRDESRTALVESLGAQPVAGDVLDGESLLRAAKGAEAIVNLAAAMPIGLSLAETKAAWEANDRTRTEGTRNLLRAARAVGTQVYVQESLLYVYGDQGDRWVDEEIVPERTRLTAAALDAEELVLGANGDDLATVVVRFGVVYSRDAWHTQLLISQARKRQLPILGDGTGFWSLIHAEDAARATVHAVEDAPGRAVYNVADDRPAPLAELFTYLADQLGTGAPRKVPVLAARVFVGKDLTKLLSGSIRLSNRLIKEELGFEPVYPSYREGLAEVLAEPVAEPI